MAIVNGYMTLPAFKAALGDLEPDSDAQYERAIEAASRQIDSWYGGQFWREPTPTARVFRPAGRRVLWTGDFATTTGLTVEVDDNNDGVFETVWSGTDWQAEPLVRYNDRPFDRIVAVGSRRFPIPHRTVTNLHGEQECPYPSLRARVRVTAAWGWPAVPAEVEQACQILSVDHFKSKDLTGGIAGFGDLGPVRIAAFNPIAKALLEPLRVPVFA